LLPDYKRVQSKIENAICDKFGLDYPFSVNLKDIDTAQLKTEARHLLVDYHWIAHYETNRKYGIVPACLSPEKAEQRFLDTFTELMQ